MGSTLRPLMSLFLRRKFGRELPDRDHFLIDDVSGGYDGSCFVDGEFPLFGRTNSYNGVGLESASSLRKLLRRAAGGGDPTLVSYVARVLAQAFPSNRPA